MNPMPPSSDTLHHHARRMRGRDPNQLHRVATPLELLFDLTFVIAFGLAASQFSDALAQGQQGLTSNLSGKGIPAPINSEDVSRYFREMNSYSCCRHPSRVSVEPFCPSSVCRDSR